MIVGVRIDRRTFGVIGSVVFNLCDVGAVDGDGIYILYDVVVLLLCMCLW